MSAFDIYVLILCLIVLVALTTLFSFLISAIIRLSVRLIYSGAEDERITAEYRQKNKTEHGCLPVVVDRIISSVLCCILFVFFGFSLYVNLSDNYISDTVPALQVVQSSSMSYKHQKNTYLFDNGLDDQFDTFDIVLTYEIPPEDQLKLYDIVVYEVGGTKLIHRIVGIEEPNNSHGEYYFLLQGDAVESPDRFPVYYSQMKGIYRGEHIPFLGSFVAFMQSVAGYLCIVLVIFGIIAIPLVEKKVNAAKMERLTLIGVVESVGSGFVAGQEDSQ